MHPPPRLTSQQTLRDQLALLGVRKGDALMLHVSMRRLGPIEGGADGLIDALVACVGVAGTLLMVLDADADEPFDPRTTPVDIEDMGVVAEVFRQRADHVNDHAAARFAAIGQDAAALLEPSPLHHYFGPGSVLERFVATAGRVLRLGANIDTVTLTHHAEYLTDVPDKRTVRRRLVRADIGEQWIESLDDSDGIAGWPHGDYFPQILLDYLAAGHARTGPVGHCTAELLDAKPFVAFAVGWMNDHLIP
jgi:aminoglycoside N3'-acetyltransferase